MKNTIKKFLQFNGKNIYFLSSNSIWYIAIKPICEALKVNYDRQYKNLKKDTMLAQLYAIQHIVASDGRLRKMVCLPEKAIYGWLFGIQSSNEALTDYKWKCNDILYNHFHGAITRRSELLQLKHEEEQRILLLQQNSPNYKEILKGKSHITQITKALNAMDRDMASGQASLF